jgi:hypothetical protein
MKHNKATLIALPKFSVACGQSCCFITSHRGPAQPCRCKRNACRGRAALESWCQAAETQALQRAVAILQYPKEAAIHGAIERSGAGLSSLRKMAIHTHWNLRSEVRQAPARTLCASVPRSGRTICTVCHPAGSCALQLTVRNAHAMSLRHELITLDHCATCGTLRQNRRIALGHHW